MYFNLIPYLQRLIDSAPPLMGVHVHRHGKAVLLLPSLDGCHSYDAVLAFVVILSYWSYGLSGFLSARL